MSRVEAPPRVCRVQPDVPAVHRAFDYLVPEALAREVRVGTMVRVPLHGRRVRGWVLEHDVVDSDVEVDRLQTIVAAVSAGPPAEVVALCRWAAWRWAGPLVTFLRAASPPNLVAAHDHAELETAVYPDAIGASSGAVADIVHALRTRSSSRHGVVEWPPGAPPEALTEALVAAEGSTIVVDPDPMRGARLLHTLRASGRDALSYSGDGSGAERSAAWSRARGGACVVVGGRLAIWAPVPDLTTIVVIDEGDEALEEERAPTWNARDVARERARRTETGIVMVTPAPTVDARYALGEPVVPARSFVRASWPRVEAIDLRREAPGHWLLTAALADALRRVRDGGGRSVCVLNRRGRARLLACVACGEATRCEACGATVVGHDEGLMCPRCDTVRPTICLQCHGSRLRAVKPGIARVRDDLAALLPRARVTAIDAGSDSIPDSDVLVGTEAVLHRAGSAFGHAAGSALGHAAGSALGHAAGSGIGLVAYLELDQELLAPRARAAEQAMWLLVRGARLLGPRDDGGLLLLQTRLPDHEVVRAAVAATPSVVATAEWERRQALRFPPFGGVAELSGATTAVGAACDTLRKAGLRVLGPTDVHGKARALVHAATPDALSDALALPGIGAAGARGRLRVDVDPRRA